jgi:hypothetical protein
VALEPPFGGRVIVGGQPQANALRRFHAFREGEQPFDLMTIGRTRHSPGVAEGGNGSAKTDTLTGAGE